MGQETVARLPPSSTVPQKAQFKDAPPNSIHFRFPDDDADRDSYRSHPGPSTDVLADAGDHHRVVRQSRNTTPPITQPTHLQARRRTADNRSERQRHRRVHSKLTISL